jgi:hypothetical protein
MLIFESHSIQFRLPNLDLSCEKNAHLTENLSQNTKQQLRLTIPTLEIELHSDNIEIRQY